MFKGRTSNTCNRKLVCDFLLDFHCNCMPIFYRFHDVLVKNLRVLDRVHALPDGENCMILQSLVLTHYQRMRQTG